MKPKLLSQDQLAVKLLIAYEKRFPDHGDTINLILVAWRMGDRVLLNDCILTLLGETNEAI